MTDSGGSRVVLSMMRLNTVDADGIRKMYSTARDLGVTRFDSSGILGGPGEHACERLFGKAVTLSSSEREEVHFQSKCGIRPGFTEFDLSKEYILEQVDVSLASLGLDYLDSLLLYRPDALVEPEEVAAACDELEASGKVRSFGVANHTVGQIELLKTCMRQPIAINQVKFGLGHAALVAQGLVMNEDSMSQSTNRDGGLIDYARVNGIQLQAIGPFELGGYEGSIFDSAEHVNLILALERIAEERGTAPSAIASAWVTRHPAKIDIVLGTASPRRLQEVVEGAGLTLTRTEWYELLGAAGYELA